MERPRERLIIVLDDLDFAWRQEDIDRVKRLWKYGLHIEEIAEYVKRKSDEVTLLLMHLSRSGKIKKRVGGVFGDRGCKKGA